MEERLCESFPAKVIGENSEIQVGEVVTVKDNLHQLMKLELSHGKKIMLAQ